MNEIQLKLQSNGKGAFVIDENDERIAEMEISISGNNLTVFHTEVAERLKGQGVAPKLLSAMVNYAREHQLKVIALCSYVSAQFKRHEEQYSDIWNKDWHNKS
jgi:predicted GNAT family acetyltransferase